MKKTIVLVLALSAVLGACSVNALAQQSCKARFDAAWYSIWNGDLIPPIPPGASNCQTNGPWAVVCDMQSYQCPPHVDNVCPTCPKAGHPIALSTGNTYIEQPDIRVPGLSRGLTLVRVWNSRTGYAVGLFGRGWRSTYEESIFVDSENYIDYSRGDDSIWSFGFYGMDPAGTGDSVFWTAAPANGGASLQSTILRVPAKSYWTLTFKDGEKRVFDMALQRLTAIVDRNGNTTQLAYDASNRLATVTDPGGRHLYFNYGASGNLVQSVTTDFGISLSYTYDAQQRLTQVTYPDNTFKTFQYDVNSYITAVLDSQGKVLESHTYNGCGQGLTGSRANGVEALSVSYPLGCGMELP